MLRIPLTNDCAIGLAEHIAVGRHGGSGKPGEDCSIHILRYRSRIQHLRQIRRILTLSPDIIREYPGCWPIARAS